MSLIDLRTTPGPSDTLVLPGRFESENRSHAFNSRIDGEGKGLIGMPVIPIRRRRPYWWWSQMSDLGYLETTAAGKLTLPATLNATRTDPQKPSRSWL